MDRENPEQTIYNAYSYKPLSYLDQWKRSEGHKWGVSTLCKIIEKDIADKKAKIKHQIRDHKIVNLKIENKKIVSRCDCKKKKFKDF